MKDGGFQKFMRDQADQKESFFLEAVQPSEAALFAIFKDAVNRHDRKKIIELADAIFFVKGKYDWLLEKPMGKPNANDWERAKLLLAKFDLSSSGKKWKRRQVAEFLYGKGVKSADVDWKTLINKCREMDFPLDEKRRTRKK